MLSRADWLTAVLEEYRSLRAEAVAAREAQLSILRVAPALPAALIGVGLSVEGGEQLLSGLLLAVALPVTVGVTFELWLDQVQRTVRAGVVVEAIERRLANAFEDLGEGLEPPLGWESWLRGRESELRPFGLSRHRWESTSNALMTFAFLLVVTVGGFVLGLSMLHELGDEVAMYFALAAGILTFAQLATRSVVLAGGLGRMSPPTPEEIWPATRDTDRRA